MAIGDQNCSSYINVSQNSVSSSILEMLPAHLDSASGSKYVRREEIKVCQLDNFKDKFKKHKNILLKIDAQGYENFVLEGAKELLLSKNLKGLLIEVSFTKLYKNQKTFDYFYRELKNKGFIIWAMENVFIEQTTGKLLQTKLLTFKNNI
jgi:Methyltransferase FkbM domain